MSQNVDIVVIALYALGGHSRPIDTEDVALKAYEIAPDRFSWTKYPDQINLELVRVTLSDGKKVQAGQLVAGSGRTGWRLTPDGVRRAQEHAQVIDESNLSRRRELGQGGGIEERRWRAERQRLSTSAAWHSWVSAQLISSRDALDLFRIDVYTSRSQRATKVSRFTLMFAKDDELRPFLEAAERALPEADPAAAE